MDAVELLMTLLAIPSPTYGESDKADMVSDWVSQACPAMHQDRVGNTVLARHDVPGRPILAWVGHLDTVPPFFEPYQSEGRIHGSGASDMQAGLAGMMAFVANHFQALSNQYSIWMIWYDKEEGTPLKDNGLHALIQAFPDDMAAIDMAIVAEPTNNAIQLGCVGSLHYAVTVSGQAAHSARPWDGCNALYNALPLITAIRDVRPVAQRVFGVEFFDVMSITESAASPGRTTVPDTWQANINYRFSPVHTLADAKAYVQTWVQDVMPDASLRLVDAVDAGKVVPHPWLDWVRDTNRVPIQAKQAWTDVAQLTAMGVCAINFGPGRQDQAHHPNEYACVDDMLTYDQQLNQLFLGG